MWSLPPFVQNTFPSVLDGGLLLAGACTIAVVSRPYYQSLDLAIAPLGRVTRATRKQAACLINELPASNPVAAPAELSPFANARFLADPHARSALAQPAPAVPSTRISLAEPGVKTEELAENRINLTFAIRLGDCGKSLFFNERIEKVGTTAGGQSSTMRR